MDAWIQAKRLFQTAVALQPSERIEFLKQIRDGQIRQQVEQLLQNYEEAGNFLNDPALDRIVKDDISGHATDVEVATETVTSADIQEPMAGRRVGAYRLIRRIGQGGMAVVFLAMRADDEYYKEVAIKLIPATLGSNDVLSRFRKERQTLAGLDHPNIVKLLDGGSTSEGLPFFVMDYVEGCPIDEYCDRHKLCVDDRLRLFCKVCEAVQYAHHHSVIHRDLKPSNILVISDGTPKLLDFGIAKVLPSAGSDLELLLTHTGTRCMTPAYASPEQMRVRPITTATDIYSLGVLLYELLTGHQPYRLAQHTPAEIERAICEQDPEPPSTVVHRVETDTSDGISTTKTLTPELVSETREGQPEKLCRRLRGDLDNIVLKALQKEPERRFESVEDFSRDIGRHLQRLPVKARPNKLTYRSTKFLQRHTVEVSAVLTIMILVVATILLTLRTLRRDRRLGSTPNIQIQSLAVLPLLNLSGDGAQDYFSDGLTDALITDLSQLGSLKVVSRTSIMRYKKTDKSIPQIARDLNVEGIVEGAVQRSGNRVRITAQLIHGPSDKHIWANTYEREVRDVFTLEREVTQDITHQIQARLSAQEERQLVQSQRIDPKVLDAYLQGNYYLHKVTWGDSDMRTAQKYFQQAINGDASFAPAYIGMAYSHLILLRSSTEDRMTRRTFAEKAVALDPTSSDAHAVLAEMESADWNWSAAEAEYRRAVTLNPNNANARSGLCDFLDIMGRLDESLGECQIAQEVDPNNDHLRQTMEARGQYDRAIELLRRDIERNSHYGVLHYFLYRDYALKGMYTESIHELEQSLSMLGFVQMSLDVHHTFNRSGYRAALLAFAKDLELLHTSGQIFVPRILAELYTTVGNKDRAFYWLEQGYQHHDRVGTYGDIALLKIAHQLDPLRSDPRYADLVRRIGLPQ